ncbi:MAG TPA: aldo/keto reductase [Candidatus Binatus sp.]|jgi:aryl-alcohol dehydrogenase-like predicted oxidoreductase|nr:aldo/keto reductase [Candidatus Binatus sp.]
MSLKQYVTLGRSGLRVSPLALGTMTFGTEWGWGSEPAVARQVFDGYIEEGGNFIDTADGYTNGKSEELLGHFIAERGLRERLVLATKFTFNADPANPNAGGNGRKNIYRALEGSLRRLKTDYMDLYWMHVWDMVTPVEEVLSTMNDLVRAGKIRHFGFSDVPAWYVARAQTLAEKEGKERLIALQLEYSLIERNIEREHIPVAQELGIGICPWSPLAGGFLSGKYRREGNTGRGQGRLDAAKFSQLTDRFTERNWRVLDALLDVAKQLNKKPAQVALNWVATQPGITSTIIGASNTAQLQDNLSALAFTVPAELRKRLDDASAIELFHPYTFFEPFIQNRVKGENALRAWTPASGQQVVSPEKSDNKPKANAAEK